MDGVIEAVASWHSLVGALVLFGFAPGFVLRLLVRVYPKDNPRRRELVAELYVRRRLERPFYVAEQIETVLFEGLPHRAVALRRWLIRTEAEPSDDADAVFVPQLLATPAIRYGMAINELLGQLDPTGPGTTAAVVSAVAGPAGVGKTTLVLRAAHAAMERGWFPDGTLFIDLRGYALDPDDRVVPGQAFARLLRGLGVPAENIPVELDEQAAVYHQVLVDRAEAGRSVLLLLDNASSTDQLAGLLPAHAAHRVLVTSRHTLGDLDGARIIDLDILDRAEAVDLVDQALREHNPADTRISDHPDHAKDLVERCGRLPLALRIAAELLADDPGMTVTGLADKLADSTTRLNTLTYDDSAMAAAFDLSWHHLEQHDPDAARLFRLLPLNPGRDISTQAAAALADLPAPQVQPLLRVLRRAHLLEPRVVPDRWAMHDLVRAYAAGLPEAHTGERAAAINRLLQTIEETSDRTDPEGKPQP